MSEQEAIRRVLAGEADVYRVLMERHFAAVLRMTFRVTGSTEDAEEAAQEALVRAYNKLPSFREHAAFGTWVYRIGMNCALNLVKRRKRDLGWNAVALDDAGTPPQHLAVSPDPTPEALLLDSEAARERERAMSTLTSMERTAFALRHLEDQPVDVIARALGVTANSARQTIFRAVSKLRRELSPSRSTATTPPYPSRLVREP